MITLHKFMDNAYEVQEDGGRVIGDFLKDRDGKFYFHPAMMTHRWTSMAMRAVAEALSDLNGREGA